MLIVFELAISGHKDSRHRAEKRSDPKKAILINRLFPLPQTPLNQNE
jgi:hypothetical protein